MNVFLRTGIHRCVNKIDHHLLSGGLSQAEVATTGQVEGLGAADATVAERWASRSDCDERARYGVYALDRRAAEAAALRDWATAALNGAWAGQPLLVCGDLNDTMEAATTELLFGPPGSQIGTGGFDHPDHGDPQRLWDVGYKMTPPSDYSRINQGRHELIDHILVSHALIEHLTDAATVPLDVPSIGLQPQVEPRTDPPSDHRPVLAHFDL